jgi:hypothetical protein
MLQTELAVMTAELKALRATNLDHVVGADAQMPPIKFKDAVGRKFNFPWHICKTWKGMESLIKQCFLHVDVIGPHVQEGHYDLMGTDGTIILPQLWEAMIKPDCEITMFMWPIPEPPKKDKKTKKAKPDLEPPIIHDPNGEPVVDNPFAGMNLHDFINLDPSTSITDRKTAKKKGKDKAKPKDSNPFSEPILEAYPPMPRMHGAIPQAAPVTVEIPPRLRYAALEERIKEVDRDFSERHSTRSTKRKNDTIPTSFDAPIAYSEVEDLRIPTTEKNDERAKEDVLDGQTPFPEDSDAEDAMLDDEALKKKMLMKYASGVATVDETEPAVRRNLCFPNAWWTILLTLTANRQIESRSTTRKIQR